MHRDPETGKFQSGSPTEFDRREAVHGSVLVGIPAADLNGGTQFERWSGSDAVLVDLEEILDSNEVFHLQVLYATIELHAHTTATAEGSVVAGYTLGMRSVNPEPISTRTTANSEFTQTDFTSDIIDGAVADLYDEDTFLIGNVVASPSHSDTVNALAAGASNYNEARAFRPWADMGQTIVMDDNDQIRSSGELNIENIDDHAVNFSMTVSAHGWVEELG